MDAKPAAVATRVRVPKSAELVADQLRRQIVRGELSEGDSLPSEAVLMEMFGVSRPTLREAFRVLESQTLISVSRGARGGARVRLPEISVASGYAGILLQTQGTTLEDVYLARMSLECSAILLLAAGGKAINLDGLRAALEAEADVIDAPVQFLTCAGRFHTQLVASAGNQTLTLMTSMLEGVIDRHAEVSGAAVQSESSASKSFARAHQVHEDVLGMIEDGQGSEATELWTRHSRSAVRAMKAESRQTVIDLFD